MASQEQQKEPRENMFSRSLSALSGLIPPSVGTAIVMSGGGMPVKADVTSIDYKNPSVAATVKKASFHMDTSRQYHIFEVLEGPINPLKDGGFSGSPVTTKFSCPLGYDQAQSEENKSYLDQRVHSMKIFIDDKEVPFSQNPNPKNPKPFWCLVKEELRGGDLVAVRVTPPAGSTKPLNMRVELDLTNIVRVPVDEGKVSPTEPITVLSNNLRKAYQSTNEEPLFHLDPERLKKLFSQPGYNINWTAAQTTRELNETMLQFYASREKYMENSSPRDINSIFEDLSMGKNCNGLAHGYVMGTRVLGATSRFIGGRYAGSDDGHGLVQVLDEQLGTFVTIDPTSYAGKPLNPSNSAFQLIGSKLDKGFIAFQAGVASRMYDSIPGETPRLSQRYSNDCGAWIVFSDGKKLGMTFPHSVVAKDKFERLSPGNAGYVTYP